MIGLAATVAGLVGCGKRPPLPRGLDRVAPGATMAELALAAPAFRPIGGDAMVYVAEEPWLCLGKTARAIAVGSGLSTVIYRRGGPEAAPLQACFDEILREPPPGWTLLGLYECGANPARREAYYAVDARWGVRLVDGSRAAPAFVEGALLADPDLRADARRATSGGCRPLPQ